jgi:hypothetical protein
MTHWEAIARGATILPRSGPKGAAGGRAAHASQPRQDRPSLLRPGNMASVPAVAQRLSTPASQLAALQSLLTLAASGTDITPATPFIVRHVLQKSVASSPPHLSLAYDALLTAPSNPHWVETLASLSKSLASSNPALNAVALSKLPQLPHPALAHLALVAGPAVTAHLTSPSSPAATRLSAVAALAAVALRQRPLTAPQAEPLRLDPLSVAQIGAVRAAVEHALHALVTAAVADPDPAVALAALRVLAEFAAASDAVEKSSVLRATCEATAAVIWDLLLGRVKGVAARFEGVAVGSGGGASESEASGVEVRPRAESARLFERRSVLRSLSRVAAHALSGASFRRRRVGGGGDDGLEEANVAAEEAAKWAVPWVDRVLAVACDDADWRVAACAATCLLNVCSFCKADVGERKVRWGCKAVGRIVRVLSEHGRGMSSLVSAGLVKDGFRGLAGMSKEAAVGGRFVVATAVGLLPHVTALVRVGDRLEGMVVVASTVVEFDLSGRDGGGGAALAAVTGSPAWKATVAGGSAKGEDARQDVDDATAAELVCCFGQALLDASRKIVAVSDRGMREGLMTVWAAMLAKLLGRTVGCLSWPYSSASSFAKEMFLKVFEALGQYSSYVTRTRGAGLEEYERLQEVLVSAAARQEDVNTRAALLICVTKYWLASALKAEANAGHVLKAIWRHAQEHFRDDQVMLKELRTGALWSDARTGGRTPAQRSTEGGYVSMVTAATKRTRAVIDTVGTAFTEVVETQLFGSIALATSAAEGSTLTTDFAHSSLASLLALVHRNPTHAEKAIELARRYVAIMERAESADRLVLEAVHNTIAAMEMYMDEFLPKPVAPRPDMAASLPASAAAGPAVLASSDPHAWLANVTESCVYATSRLDDPSKESVTVSTEEAVLHASSVSRLRLRPLHPGSLQSREPGVENPVQGDQQTLSGASDPFGVVASHAMDTVKALATLQVNVVNRSVFQVSNVSLCYSAGGALTPLPDAATSHVLGSLAPGASASQRVTLAVRHNQGFAARVQFTIHVREDGAEAPGGCCAEQACLPYYVPSSDVLLLRSPPASAGVDVFRRRWDLMREASSFHVVIRQNQDLDGFVDTLERRSGCLRQVGRMRVSSHVSAMVADSSRGDYIALAALAPEARGDAGAGPCLVYVTIRSNSAAYSLAFRNECRGWLRARFKVVVLEDDPNQARKIQALHPQDAYFSNDSRGMSDYQRWRAAHAARMASS